jgi:hypothetical protein
VSLGIYSGDAAKTEHRGVIYAIGPSPLNVNVIWTGSDDGVVHVTRDGGATWTDVTPNELTAWSKVTQIDASHADAATAYISVSRFRVDDLTPLVFRTHDGGKTWTKITRGLADNASVNVVREDRTRRDSCSRAPSASRSTTATTADADAQPATYVGARSHRARRRLAIATHGRGFWILDNMTPLRRLARTGPVSRQAPPSSIGRKSPIACGTATNRHRFHRKRLREETHRTAPSSTTTSVPTPPHR